MREEGALELTDDISGRGILACKELADVGAIGDGTPDVRGALPNSLAETQVGEGVPGVVTL